MGKGDEDEPPLRIEETRAAIRDSVERAKELVEEARLRMAQRDAGEPGPPDAGAPDAEGPPEGAA